MLKMKTIAVALLASAKTQGRVERQAPAAQIAPLELMAGRHLPPTPMATSARMVSTSSMVQTFTQRSSRAVASRNSASE